MSRPISRILLGGGLLAALTLGAAAAPRGARPAAPKKPKPAARKATPAVKPAAAAPAVAKTAMPALSKEEALEFFVKEVKPILVDNCLACHAGEHPQGGLKLGTRADFLKGGISGPAVSLQKPDSSLFLHAINYQGKRMPPKGKLPKPQIDTLTRWVKLGLPWPEDEHGDLEAQGHGGPPQVNERNKKFWAFQPVKRPPIPTVKNKAWVRNPVDAFVLSKLEKAGFAPNPPADRATLIRRAYYDLIGLPPTPEEVAAFVNDSSPNAWEKLVDRLLASPHYGEKWGRHWLDLVRYAETNSYERDGEKPEAWRYRDYVINSFNQDKPYNQFVVEQLAGDELDERTPERLIATGYYRLGIWDDEPADPKQALYDDLDDIANTTGQVFLGLTVGCARCHDHKLDPMPQKDYYRFLAFFAGVNRYGVRSHESVMKASLRPIAPPEQIEAQRAEIAAHQEKLKRNQELTKAIEDKVMPDLAPVEKEEWRASPGSHIPTVKKRIGKLITQEEFDQYAALKEERKQLERFRPRALDMALSVTELEKPRETFVLLRGSPHAEGDKVTPGFFTVLDDREPVIPSIPHKDTSGRRLALARWIASESNPLTARVMVNRVWHYHFGRGIVRSTSNFGFQGDRPTHPELLDWLASEFTSNGWKLKPLHKLVMMSSTYQMSSRANEKALAKDPENNLLWRFDMRRLLAEEVRDSVLAVNGTLNLKAGGPSIFPAIPAEVLAGQSRPGEGWRTSQPEEQRRRSVYIFAKRSLPVPIIAAFDGPETDFSCAARFTTTQPTQALGMLNSEWMNEQAVLFAQFLKKQAGDQPEAQVRLALRRTLQRVPTAKEVERGVKLITTLQQEELMSADQALASFCLVALNLNEFIYLD